MDTRKWKILYSIFIIFGLSEHFADCCLREYSDNSDNELSFLFKIFNEYQKIYIKQMAQFSLDDIRNTISRYGNMKFVLENLSYDISGLHNKAAAEITSQFNESSATSYAVVWMVQGMAAKHALTFSRGFLYYSKEQEYIKAWFCGYLAAHLAAFASYENIYQAFSNMFVHYAELAIDKEVSIKALSVASQYSTITKELHNIYEGFNKETGHPNLDTRGVNVKEKYDFLCSYFGYMIFGRKEKDPVDEIVLWEMAESLFTSYHETIFEYKLVTLLLRLEMIDADFDGSKLGFQDGELKLTCVMGEEEENIADELKLVKMKSEDEYYYANGTIVV